MAHIRRKIEGTPSATNRLAYVVVITSDWAQPLEEHPKVVNYPDLYEITNDEIPTDMSIWSVEFEGNESV
jgi:hypothetical protein